MQTEKPKSYTTTPRYIVEDYLDKKLTRSEFILCLWLRSTADINGYTTTSVTAIRDDMFPGVEVNTVQKLLLSLRKKKYVYFPNHQGRRGSIRIESDDWLMKTKGTKSIAHRFSQNNVTTDALSIPEPIAELEQTLGGQNQKLIEQKRELSSRFSGLDRFDQFTSHHNEHNNENEKGKNTVGSTFKGTLTKDFTPMNAEERRCKDIALALGDEYINSILNVLRKNKRGMWALEKAWEVYEENVSNGKQVSNPAGYYNGIVKKILLKEL